MHGVKLLQISNYIFLSRPLYGVKILKCFANGNFERDFKERKKEKKERNNKLRKL